MNMDCPRCGSLLALNFIYSRGVRTIESNRDTNPDNVVIPSRFVKGHGNSFNMKDDVFS